MKTKTKTELIEFAAKILYLHNEAVDKEKWDLMEKYGVRYDNILNILSNY